MNTTLEKKIRQERLHNMQKEDYKDQELNPKQN